MKCHTYESIYENLVLQGEQQELCLSIGQEDNMAGKNRAYSQNVCKSSDFLG